MIGMIFMKNKSITLLVGDPARAGDSFGSVAGIATWPKKEIHYRYAKEFKRKSYDVVAKHFRRIAKVINPHMILLEDNFEKDNVNKAFKKNGINVNWIHSSANLTDEKKRQYHSLDKPFVVEWLAEQRRLKRVFYADNKKDDMDVLVIQTDSIISFMTQNGSTTYRATRGRHDDLYICSIIFANFVRIWWDELDGVYN